MKRKRKVVVRLSDNNLENTLYNVLNKGVNNFNSSYIPSETHSNYKPPQPDTDSNNWDWNPTTTYNTIPQDQQSTNKNSKINLPEFSNPFSKIKIPDITIALEPSTKQMIDVGIKTLSGAIVIHGLLSYLRNKK